MNILILSDNTICDGSLLSFPYHNVLDCREHNLYLLINSDVVKKDHKIIDSYSDKYKKIIAYDNYLTNALVEYDAININKENTIDVIIAMHECDLLRASRLRDFFQIDGQSYESALAFRNKILMKSFVKKSGLAVPEFKKITNGIDLISFIEKHGYPVYVKPISSAGSVGGFQIRDERELRATLSDKLVNTTNIFGEYIDTLEVEQFIDEELFAINGIILDGELVLFHPAKYGACQLLENLMQLDYNTVETMSRSNPLYNVMQEYIRKLVKSLPSPRSFAFHAEVFIDKNMNITLCEIASRPPGGGIIPMISLNYGIDMFEIITLIQANPRLIDKEYITRKCDDYNEIYACMRILPKEGLFIAAKENCPLPFVKGYQIIAERKKRYSKVAISSEGIAFFIVCGDDEVQLKNNIAKSAEWFWENCSWEVETLVQN